MPVFFKEATGFKSEVDVIESTSNTFVFGEPYTLEGGGGVPSGHRLYVGGLSMNANDQPEGGDEVLVLFEHGDRGGTHPDFLWVPSWIL
jgi:hypothetical protein